METKKFKNMGRGVYISLAICMLVIAGVGIFASVRSVSNLLAENVEELDDLSVSSDLISGYFPSIKETDLPDSLEAVPETNPVANEPIVWIEPVSGEIQKRYSEGELVYSETMNDYRTHNGIDISASDGTAVVSVADGTVKDVRVDPLWGTVVSVDHGNGIVSVYKNLSNTLPEGIEIGAFVEEGGVVGAVSSGALVEIGEASHLHLEVIANGEVVDPVKALSIYE